MAEESSRPKPCDLSGLAGKIIVHLNLQQGHGNLLLSCIRHTVPASASPALLAFWQQQGPVKEEFGDSNLLLLLAPLTFIVEIQRADSD